MKGTPEVPYSSLSFSFKRTIIFSALPSTSSKNLVWIHPVHVVVFPCEVQINVYFCPFQRKACVKPTSDRVGIDRGIKVVVRTESSSKGPRCNTERSTECDVSFGEGFHILHDDCDEGHGLEPYLWSHAQTVDFNKEWPVPGIRQRISSQQNSLAVLTTHHPSEFQILWNNEDASCSLQKRKKGTAVWLIEKLLKRKVRVVDYIEHTGKREQR